MFQCRISKNNPRKPIFHNKCFSAAVLLIFFNNFNPIRFQLESARVSFRTDEVNIIDLRLLSNITPFCNSSSYHPFSELEGIEFCGIREKRAQPVCLKLGCRQLTFTEILFNLFHIQYLNTNLNPLMKRIMALESIRFA